MSAPPKPPAGDGPDPGPSPNSEHPRAGRSGRRRNGLTAAAYAALVDIDPQLATTLLGALHRAGVAAYVEPVPGSVGGYLEVRLPDRPTDRLWCDHRQRELARTVVEHELADAVPRLAEPASDPAWEAVLASWRLSGGADTPTATQPPPRPGPGDADDDVGDHYVAPPPPPLPRVQPATRWAVIAMLGGLVALAAPWLLGLGDSSTTATLAVLAIVGGGVTLVWRMRDGPPPDEMGSDDGAVV